MLSIKKTFLALLTASVFYESSAAIAIPTKNDDRGRVLGVRRSTGQKATNKNVFQPAQALLNRSGSLATHWFRPTHTFFTQKGSVAARSMRIKATQNVSNPIQNLLNRSGSLAAHWFRPTQTLVTQKGQVAARSVGTTANQNVFKPAQSLLTQSRSLSTDWFRPTQTLVTQKGPAAAHSVGTKTNQNVFKPTQSLLNRSGSLATDWFRPMQTPVTQKGPAARSVGTKANQNVFRPTQQGSNQKIRIQTADIPQEVRTALAAQGQPMTKAHYSASRAEIAEVIQLMQQAEVHGALSRGTTQTLRNTLKNKYGVAL